MNIETIKIFRDLVELQNFSRTAEKHGISQSAVSQQLAQIETTHKCQFINRKKRPLALTRSGEIFYRACKDILDRYDRLTSDLAALSKTTTRINVAAIFSIGMHTLQPYVKKFMSRYPKVNLVVDYYDARAIYEKILKGDVDIGIVAVPQQDRNVEIYSFKKETLVLVCSAENALANETKVNIHKLQGREFIAFETNVPTRRLIDNIFRQYNITVRTVMEFDNIETIKRAVEIDAGVSILPQTTIRAELANGTLAAMPFANDNFYRPTGIVVRKNKTLSVAARYLIELLQKNI